MECPACKYFHGFDMDISDEVNICDICKNVLYDDFILCPYCGTPIDRDSKEEHEIDLRSQELKDEDKL